MSLESLDDMNTRVAVDQSADLSDLKGEGSILERLLHLAGAEVAEVSLILRRSALADFLGDLGEVGSLLGDLLSDTLDSSDSFLL